MRRVAQVEPGGSFLSAALQVHPLTLDSFSKKTSGAQSCLVWKVLVARGGLKCAERSRGSSQGCAKQVHPLQGSEVL